jgi:hypothetical protein
MNVWRSGFVSYVVVVALAASGAGCAKKRSTMGPAPDLSPEPKVEANAGARADELAERSRKFDETVQQLPGRTPEEHRRAMHQVFAELSEILPMLYGPNPSGVFRQQLRVVESSRRQLATGPQGLAVEPTIDTGLRAARDAIAGLAGKGYFDQSKLGPTMDRLNRSLDALDTNRGAMHQTAVAESVGMMSQAIRQLTDAMNQRVDEGTASNAKPANPVPDVPAPDAPPETKAPEKPAPEKPAQDAGGADAAAPDPGATPQAAEPGAAEPAKEDGDKDKNKDGAGAPDADADKPADRENK